MPGVSLPPLTADQVDDILYLTRTNESEELSQYLNELSQSHNCTPSAILEACIDDASGNTAFHYCAANGFTDLLTALLSTFKDPNTSTKDSLNRKNTAGNTPLHWAALNGHAATVKALTNAGADVWVKNAAGNLPVFEAERAEKDEVVAILLLAGGKEVEEQLAAKEGAAKDEDVVDTAGAEVGEGSSRDVEDVAEKLEDTQLER